MTPLPASSARSAASAPPTHGAWLQRLYLLLAVFHLCLVGTSLVLSHRLGELHGESLAVRAQLAELRRLAGAANAPGNDVFDTHEVDSARLRLEEERRGFLAALEGLRARVPGQEPGMRVVAQALEAMCAEARQLLTSFAAGQPAVAGEHMATMDRRLVELNAALAAVEREIARGEGQRVAALGRIEAVLGTIAVLLVGAACAYGYRLSRQARRDELERLRYMGELEQLNQRHTEALEQVAVLTAAARSAANAILITDRSGRISWVNPATSELTGYGEAELLGTPLNAEVGPLAAGTGLSAQPWHGQVVTRRKDGRFIVEEQTVAPVPGSSGEIEHFVAIRRDVTRQKQAEDALLQANAEISQILQAIQAILIGIDASGRVRSWNAHAERELGIPAELALGAELGGLALRLEGDPMPAALGRCLANGTIERLDDLLFERADGERRVLGLSLNPMLGPDGKARGCLILGRDVTNAKRLEAELARAQKLESLGQLAAGVAHEINTPTQFVSDNTRFLQSSLAELVPILELCARLSSADAADGQAALLEELGALVAQVDVPFVTTELPRAVEESLGGLERITGIVRAMKEFSHPGSAAMELADVNRCITSTVTVARNEWKYVADLKLDLAPDLPPVPCYPQDLNQVVLNMIVNAAHAIQDARTRGGTEALGKIEISTRVRGDEFELRISDSGCGMPPEIQARIFDPFFTTKEVGKGTGQGLAIAHQVVVERHGGRIEVESEPGRGTTFCVRLPLRQAAGAAA